MTALPDPNPMCVSQLDAAIREQADRAARCFRIGVESDWATKIAQANREVLLIKETVSGLLMARNNLSHSAAITVAYKLVDDRYEELYGGAK